MLHGQKNIKLQGKLWIDIEP